MGLDVNPLAYLASLARFRAFITTDNAENWMPDTFSKGVADAENTLALQAGPGYRICHRRVKERIDEHEITHSTSPPRVAPSTQHMVH